MRPTRPQDDPMTTTTKTAGWILILASTLLPLLVVAGTGGSLEGSEFEEVYTLLQAG